MASSSFVSSLQRRLAEPASVRRKEMLAASDAVRHLDASSLPPVEFMQNIGAADPSHFLQSSVDLFQELVTRYDADPDWTVLDIGCGCGRHAFPFAEFLNDHGSYIGVDVWPEGIQWCTKRFEQPNFTFECLDIADNYYYQDSRTAVRNDLTLSFVGDATVDLAFGISVFTHLTADDLRSYLRELGRVMKPGRAAHFTCFIADSYFRAHQAETGRFAGAKEEAAGCWYGFRRQDFFAAFSLENLKQWIDEAGMELAFYELGNWAAKPGARRAQDLLVLYNP